ncbi:MAG: O-antigen ligase family protein, partial [Acidobacteriota bacterium]|nr:O-antigen ligase family protein [Acidobacteriota bacterium]
GATLGLAALVGAVRRRDAARCDRRWAIVLVSALLAIGLLQLIPLPAPAIARLAPPTAELREDVTTVLPGLFHGALPESLSAPATLDAVLRFTLYVLLGIAASVAFRRRRHVRLFLLVLAASGTFQAVYGSAEYLSGHQHIFGYAKEFYVESATGTFINRNHFASYLAMTLPMAMGALLLDLRDVPRGLSGRERIVTAVEPRHLAIPFLSLAVFAMWIGVLLSYSRGGLAAALLGTAIVSWGAARGRARIVLVVLLVLPALFVSWKEIQAPGERLATLATDLQSPKGRWAAWRAGSGMIPEYAVLGSGYGTFEPAFVSHKPPEMTGRWDYAHNDWLQAFIEGGIPAGIILVVLFGAVVRRAVRPPRLRQDLLAACLSAAIFAAAFHGLFDFAAKVPAIAALLACQVGVLIARPIEEPRPRDAFG